MNRNELNRELRYIERKMKEMYQAQIKRQKLIKTGAMYASMEVKLINGKTGLRMEVSSTDYFPYVDRSQRITKTLFKRPAWSNLKKRLVKSYSLFCRSEVIRLASK